jgi:hypothetical protein
MLQMQILEQGFSEVVDEVVVITWTQVFGSWTPDFASLDCTTWIQPQLQAMAWCGQWGSGYLRILNTRFPIPAMKTMSNV